LAIEPRGGRSEGRRWRLRSSLDQQRKRESGQASAPLHAAAAHGASEGMGAGAWPTTRVAALARVETGDVGRRWLGLAAAQGGSEQGGVA
jgi:hypothetical protein